MGLGKMNKEIVKSCHLVPHARSSRKGGKKKNSGQTFLKFVERPKFKDSTFPVNTNYNKPKDSDIKTH